MVIEEQSANGKTGAYVAKIAETEKKRWSRKRTKRGEQE